MPSALEQAGAVRDPSKFAPIHVSEFFTGLWTQRSPFRDAATPHLLAKFYQASRFESLIGGADCELTSRLTLKRRPGHSVYNSQTFPAITRFYEFRTFSTNSESIQVIADTAGVVYDATGPSTKTAILTKAIGATDATCCGAGNVLYIGDGVEQKAYQKSPTVLRNWGIAKPAGSGDLLNGPNTASAAVDGGEFGGGGATWTASDAGTLVHATATADGIFAVRTVGAGGSGNSLQVTGFGFAVVGQITLITVEVKCQTSTSPTSLSGGLIKGGVLQSAQNFGLIPTTNGSLFLTFDGSGWTAADINAANFGFFIPSLVNFSASADNEQIDIVKITVSTSSGGGPSVAVVAGALSPTKGYSYVSAYGNSTIPSGRNISNPTLPSANTGPQAAKNFQVGVTASPDAQVNEIHVYRTLDTGLTAGPYLELPNSPFPNTTTTITDSATDAQLNAQASFPFSPYTANTPPPAGAIDPVYHLSRIWVHSGNTVFYSNAPGASLGNNLEQVPPNNFFVFPSRVIRKLVCAAGLLVWTTNDIWLIAGQGITGVSPFYSCRLQAGFGIAGYDAIAIYGTELWFMATDGRVLRFDTNSIVFSNGTFTLPQVAIDEPGFPIGDQFGAGTYTPTNVMVTWHRGGSADNAVFVSDRTTGWFRGAHLAPPESGFAWSPKAGVVVGCSAVQSVQVATAPNAVINLLIGPSVSGAILKRDPSVRTDNGVLFAWNAVIGSILLAQSGASIGVEHFAMYSIGATPQVFALLNEIAETSTAKFVQLYRTGDEPAVAPTYTATSYHNDRFDFQQQGKSQKWCQHLQVKVAFAAEDVAEELLMYAIFGQLHDEH